MVRLILFVVAVYASCASAVAGDDYILRIEAIDHAVAAIRETAPHDVPIYSIEVFARPRLPFHGRFRVGAETISASGKLRAADNGEFVAELRIGHSVDTGKTILGDDGAQEPVIEKSLVRTSVTIPVGSSVDISGLIMKDANTRRTRQLRHVVTLMRYEPPEDR